MQSVWQTVDKTVVDLQLSEVQIQTAAQNLKENCHNFCSCNNSSQSDNQHQLYLKLETRQAAFEKHCCFVQLCNSLLFNKIQD